MSVLACGAAPFACFPVLLLDGWRMRPNMLVEISAALCWLCTNDAADATGCGGGGVGYMS